MPQVSQGLMGSGVMLQPEGSGCPARPPWGRLRETGLADRRGAACFPAGPGALIFGLLPSRGLYFPASTLEPKAKTDFKRISWKHKGDSKVCPQSHPGVANVPLTRVGKIWHVS